MEWLKYSWLDAYWDDYIEYLEKRRKERLKEVGFV